MTHIAPNTSLGELVAEHPSCAGLFERLRIDYCCAGRQTLAEACERRGLDVETVRELIEALDADPLRPSHPLEESDWRRASLGELCDHIVTVHHAELRRELPRISEMLAKVVRVHGRDHSGLDDLERVFTGMRSELESHIELEERAVFPACHALEAGDPDSASLDTELIDRHEREHQGVGDALAAMRELTDGYDPANALCGTHRALLEALRGLELDLHQHVHEENNVLFPRLRALAEAKAR
ncbi:MAG: iron-sulfur cluster repair di-iron protein [Solirubrobacterales bacterium]